MPTCSAPRIHPDREFAAFIDACAQALDAAGFSGRPSTDADREFGAFVDACSCAFDAATLLAMAFAQGRGSALAEAAQVPSPSTSADRHARYKAGIRKPPARRSAVADRVQREAQAWGWSR